MSKGQLDCHSASIKVGAAIKTLSSLLSILHHRPAAASSTAKLRTLSNILLMHIPHPLKHSFYAALMPHPKPHMMLTTTAPYLEETGIAFSKLNVY